MYQPRRIPRSEFVPIRTLDYHVWVWGERREGVPPLVMVHGWMDIGASFQFVVDEFGADRFAIAPDWRGYGLTEMPDTDSYWFADYLADLDFLLDRYCPEAPVDLVGHSMGGNVAMMYSGVRPARVRRLVNLEGFGMARTSPGEAPGRYAKWIDQLKALHRGDLALKAYDSAEGVARRLMKTNPRLERDKAEWLARHWAREGADGLWRILGHDAHKIVNANLHQVEETLELYRSITAPTLMVEASDNSLEQWWQGRYGLAEWHQRLSAVSDVRRTTIDDAGHMLHHDQPRELARLIEDFLRA
ncbi:MAG TPA: alpha/beta hydrolase [Ramlibacter sp.]|uniref:alpha/beta fold hydrolase n=1 Tax=Ramlibacter sp. TaxID=1917967 RepID=UPI002CAD5724|nr:alpha/beta hydrolase [Ramlibacter sp.]HVZ46065.1 alpha/beta hydrolase [Ramlibacter sp.]